MSAEPLIRPDEPREFTREEVALHEAGHAVAAIRVGCLPDGFRVVVLDRPDAHRLGFVRPARPRRSRGERPTRERLAFLRAAPECDSVIASEIVRTAIYSFAGAAAQFPRSRGLRGEILTASRRDRAQFVAFARRFGRIVSDWEPWITYARVFVDAHWGQILAVALVLYERGELTAADVLEIANAAEPAVNRRPLWDPRDPDPESVGAAEWTLPNVPAAEIARAPWVDRKVQR
jgi:hypothetical protein